MCSVPVTLQMLQTLTRTSWQKLTRTHMSQEEEWTGSGRTERLRHHLELSAHAAWPWLLSPLSPTARGREPG